MSINRVFRGFVMLSLAVMLVVFGLFATATTASADQPKDKGRPRIDIEEIQVIPRFFPGVGFRAPFFQPVFIPRFGFVDEEFFAPRFFPRVGFGFDAD